jgi:hypothetical protein
MRPVRLAVSAAVVAAAGIALAACAPEPGPGATSPAPSAAPTTEAPRSPEPTASETPAPEPTGSAGALPADCASAYSPQMADRLREAFGQLNPEGGSYNTHFMGDLYDIVQPLPTLTCLWSPPGEVALMTDAILVGPDQADDIRAVLSANIPGCQDTGGDFVCLSESEQTQGAKRTEYHVLHGDLLLLSAGLNADFALVQEAVADMIATIEG